MFRKLKNIFYNIFYSLPFGLKGADGEIFGSKTNNSNNIASIEQNYTQNKLSNDLLKGIVSQEVEELRYRTYRIAQESTNYEYLGEGIAVKKKAAQNENILKLRNGIICEGVTHELNRVNDYSVDRYVLNIEYKDISRFRLEKYCNNFQVDLKNKKISFFFEKNTNIPETRMFFNELDRILDKGVKSEIMDYPKDIKFVMNDTFSKYELRNLSFEEVSENKFEYIIKYSFKWIIFSDFIEKYKSKSMEEKYKNKEKKELNTISIGNNERVCHCSTCGVEINKYDADITNEEYGFPLCKDCLERLNNEINDEEYRD